MNHILVAELHAAREIPRRKNDFPVCRLPDPLIPEPVRLLPAGRLVGAGDGQEKAGIRVPAVPESDYRFRGQGIESQRAAADKPAVPGLPAIPDRPAQQTPYGGLFRARQEPVAAETNRILFCAAFFHCRTHGNQSIFRTARNASLGTWTVPNWRMRFLPSFCFSSSFFFRVISPP